MNQYYNTYTYEMFKTLHSLNLVEDKVKIEISDEDIPIMEAYWKELSYLDIDFNTFLTVVKNVSIESMRTPIYTANIMYNELKKEKIHGNKQ